MRIWKLRLAAGAMALVLVAIPAEVSLDSGRAGLDAACLNGQGCRPMTGWVCFGKDKDYDNKCPLSHSDCTGDPPVSQEP